jgi:hypothetical protein
MVESGLAECRLLGNFHIGQDESRLTPFILFAWMRAATFCGVNTRIAKLSRAISLLGVVLVILGGCATPPPPPIEEEIRVEEHYFYMNPSREAFEVFLAKASEASETVRQESGTYYFKDFLDAVFAARASEKYGYEISGSGYVPETAREILAGTSDKARFVADDSMVDVFKLDVWWASFYATGEETYLRKILDYAVGVNWTDEMAEVMGKAKRSFQSHCARHERVREFARLALEDPTYRDGRRFIQDCLN